MLRKWAQNQVLKIRADARTCAFANPVQIFCDDLSLWNRGIEFEHHELAGNHLHRTHRNQKNAKETLILVLVFHSANTGGDNVKGRCDSTIGIRRRDDQLGRSLGDVFIAVLFLILSRWRRCVATKGNQQKKSTKCSFFFVCFARTPTGIHGLDVQWCREQQTNPHKVAVYTKDKIITEYDTPDFQTACSEKRKQGAASCRPVLPRVDASSGKTWNLTRVEALLPGCVKTHHTATFSSENYFVSYRICGESHPVRFWKAQQSAPFRRVECGCTCASSPAHLVAKREPPFPGGLTELFNLSLTSFFPALINENGILAAFYYSHFIFDPLERKISKYTHPHLVVRDVS